MLSLEVERELNLEVTVDIKVEIQVEIHVARTPSSGVLERGLQKVFSASEALTDASGRTAESFHYKAANRRSCFRSGGV